MHFGKGGRDAIAAFLSSSMLVVGLAALPNTVAAVTSSSRGNYTNHTDHGGSAPYPITAASGRPTASGSNGYVGAGNGQNGSFVVNQYHRRSEVQHGNELIINTAGHTYTAARGEVTPVLISEYSSPTAPSSEISPPESLIAVTTPTAMVERGTEPIIQCNTPGEPMDDAIKTMISFWTNVADHPDPSNSKDVTLPSKSSGSCICQIEISDEGTAGISLSAAEIQSHLSAIESKCGFAAMNGDAINPAYVRVNDDTGDYTIRVGGELTCARQSGTFCVPGGFRPDSSGEAHAPIDLSDGFAQTRMPPKAELRKRQIISGFSPTSTTGPSVSCTPDSDQGVNSTQVKEWRDDPSVFNNWFFSGDFPLAPSSQDSIVDPCVQLACSNPTSIWLCNLGTRGISSHKGSQLASDLDAVLSACGRGDGATSMTESAVLLYTVDPEQAYSLAVNITGGCDLGRTKSTPAGIKAMARRDKPGRSSKGPPVAAPVATSPVLMPPPALMQTSVTAAPTASIVAGVKNPWASCNQNGDSLTENMSAVFSYLDPSRADTPTSFPVAGPLLPAIDPSASPDDHNQSCSTIINSCDGHGTKVDVCNNGWESITVTAQQVLDAIYGILDTCAGGWRPSQRSPLPQTNPGIFFNSTTPPQAYYINVFGNSSCDDAEARSPSNPAPSGQVLLPLPNET